ncbi:MAG: RnfABCDGE type electron transport complex subunit D [Bacilli bacterium]|nr:RnfABCDGE type electron transport complex subunit D [Bacilli bacterium]
MIIAKESAPHLRKKSSVTRMMVDVLIALAPTLIFAFAVYHIYAISTYLIALTLMVGSEFIYVGLKNMMPKDGLKHSFKEKFTYAYKGKFNQNNILTSAISAVIFTLIMPVAMKLPSGTIIPPIYPAIVGSLVGIWLGKLVFGGTGSNIFNPAAVGMVFAKLCFGSTYLTYVDNWYYSIPEAAAGATPLGLLNGGTYSNIGNYPLTSLLFGQIPGTVGEVFKITILIGLIYLLIRQSIDWRIVISYFGTFIVLILTAGLAVFSLDKALNPGLFTLYSLLSGGVLFGGVFMLTDPVTSPINAPSRMMYGIIAAVITVFIRLFAALPEGVAFSILIVNMLAPFLDHYEWSSARYTWKKILAICLLVIIPIVITFVIIRFGGVYHG